MYHPEDVPYSLDMSDLPDTFTPARHKASDLHIMVLQRGLYRHSQTPCAESTLSVASSDKMIALQSSIACASGVLSELLNNWS